ncbi:MAG: hypothetical protein F4Y00_07875 [Bacteroidetes bacterium SB0662_bin_6]|nr:hypothetical protein [Gammaproteobacteria bacterium]MYE04871.1 hypothetical protein [Bacteroidetes bacterium SB0662_bin_6]
MSITSEELALPAARNAYAVCVQRSGNNGFGDIPLSISISAVARAGGEGGPNGPIISRHLHIQPDAGRLLNAELVSDDLYESICNNEDALTEGQGAEELFEVMGALHELLESGRKSPQLRYSIRGALDTQLIRNYLRREGYGRLPAVAAGNVARVIDVRHALMMLAGVCRATESWETLPRKLRDYDLDCGDFAPAELCDLYGVAPSNDGSESAALLRLVLAAHGAADGRPRLESAMEKSSGSKLLKTLGKALRQLENAAPLPLVDAKVELTPSMLGLLLHNGKWTPVVHPKAEDRKAGGDYCLYSLPEGRPLLRPAGVSAPLLRLDRLESESGWTADADDRLRRICGREGELFNLRLLSDAFTQSGGGWTHRESNLIPLPTSESNPWTQVNEFLPGEELIVLSSRAACAINRHDVEKARAALDEIAKQAEIGNQGARRAAVTLFRNMRIAASRAGLLDDGRQAWLRQMAFLLDPEFWPADQPADNPCFATLLYGDGPVARHNRIAIGSRSTLGISASAATTEILTRPPRLRKDNTR